MIKDYIDLVSSFAGKDKNNILSNVAVINNTISAGNATVFISVDVESDIDFCVNAELLKKALKNCNSDNLKMDIKDNHLIVRSGRFKAKLELSDVSSYPVVNKFDEYKEIDNNLINDLKMLSSFCNTNDVRIAFHGVAINNNEIKSTNGYILAKKDTDLDLNVIIPQKTIDLLYASKQSFNGIGEDDKGNAYFSFGNGFIYTRCIDVKYPDISRIIKDVELPTPLADLKEPIKSIAQFCDDTNAILIGESISTRDGKTKIDGFDLTESAFNSDYILKVIDIAEEIDLSKYPDVCPFQGNGIKGAIAGVRL